MHTWQKWPAASRHKSDVSTKMLYFRLKLRGAAFRRVRQTEEKIWFFRLFGSKPNPKKRTPKPNESGLALPTSIFGFRVVFRFGPMNYRSRSD